MKNYNTKHTLKVKIKNKTYSSQSLTNLGSFTKTSSGYTAIKDKKNGGCMLCHISSNFKTVTYKPVKYNGKLVTCKHCNSITAVGSYFYIATMNGTSDGYTILKVNKSGKVVGRYYYYTASGAKATTTAIDYYGKIGGVDHFLFKTNYVYNADKSKKAIQFDLVKFQSGRFTSTGIFLKTNYYVPSTYTDNDITYDKTNKRIYATFFIGSGDVIKTSYIYAFDLDHVKSSHTLKVNRNWKTTAVSADKSKFEVESYLVYNKKKYVVANVNGGRDGLYQLINI